eukprot:scaffold6364_cov171-Amphora_coffeaeformis.AAC.3
MNNSSGCTWAASACKKTAGTRSSRGSSGFRSSRGDRLRLRVVRFRRRSLRRSWAGCGWGDCDGTLIVVVVVVVL